MTQPINTDTITDEQIEALRDEAGAHGDSGLVYACGQALNNDGFAGYRAARKVCAEIICETQAQQGHDDAVASSERRFRC